MKIVSTRRSLSLTSSHSGHRSAKFSANKFSSDRNFPTTRTFRDSTSTQRVIDQHQTTGRTKMAAVAAAAAASIGGEKLTFINPSGEKLVGIYVDAGSPDVVLMCHGYMANKNMCQFAMVAAALAEAGLSSFRFDHACHYRGESERKGPFFMGNHEMEVADIHAAANFLRSRGKNVTVLLGHSKGGTNVIKYAALIGDIPRVINLSGRFCVRVGCLQRFGADIFERLAVAGPEGIPRKEPTFEWFMTLADFTERAEQPMEQYAATIKEQKKVTLLCLHGREDATIPWEESEQCAAIADGELVVVEGDHNFRQPEHAEQMAAAVVEFSTRQ